MSVFATPAATFSPAPPPSLFPLLERRAASLLARRGKTRRDATSVLLAPSQAPCLTSFLPLPLSISPRSLHPLVLSRTFLPHVLLASRQCLLARRGVAILGRKDSSESALAPPPPPSSLSLFLAPILSRIRSLVFLSSSLL